MTRGSNRGAAEQLQGKCRQRLDYPRTSPSTKPGPKNGQTATAIRGEPSQPTPLRSPVASSESLVVHLQLEPSQLTLELLVR
jgi:hypothetical protein